MKYILQTASGISYFVDTDKPQDTAQRLFPEVDWMDSFYLINDDFSIGPDHFMILPDMVDDMKIRSMDRVGHVIWRGK